MKETRMPSTHAANLVANSANALYRVKVIAHFHFRDRWSRLETVTDVCFSMTTICR